MGNHLKGLNKEMRTNVRLVQRRTVLISFLKKVMGRGIAMNSKNHRISHVNHQGDLMIVNLVRFANLETSPLFNPNQNEILKEATNRLPIDPDNQSENHKKPPTLSLSLQRKIKTRRESLIS